MALASNVVKRGSTYYVRLTVPVDLKDRIGRAEVWKSLRTKEPRDARRLGALAAAEMRSEWEVMRQQRALTADDHRTEAVRLYERELELDRKRRASLPQAAEIEAERVKVFAAPVPLVPGTKAGTNLAVFAQGLDYLVMRDAATMDAERRRRLLGELRRHLAKGETALVQWAADEAITREGYGIERDGPAYRELCQSLLRAWIEALERTLEHDRGDFGGEPADSIVKPVTGAPKSVAAKPGEGVLELYDTYAAENPRAVKADTLRMNRQIVEHFADSMGPGFSATAIDKKAVREWKALLRKFPIKAAEVREFRGLSPQKIVQRNETLKRPILSTRTVNKYLSALGAFCHWLMQSGYLDSNPVDGMHTTIDKDRTRIRPYTTDQLNAIFRSPLFTEGQGTRDHAYWLPLLSLFTGARLGELAQLLVTDVRQEHGHWIAHITREGDETKTTKTKGSQRVVPVHPELIRLGFLAYHTEMTGRGSKRLFPELKPDARGNLAGHYSRAYARYVTRIGVKDDKTINFHSFRHGMADALRRAGFRDEEFGFLLGHTQATTTGRYGILPEGELSQRVRMIEAVNFPGLDLYHLIAPHHEGRGCRDRESVPL